MRPVIEIREIGDGDRDWMVTVLRVSWGSERVVSRGRVIRADALPGFVAVTGAERVGLITYEIQQQDCEIVSLNSLKQGQGIGSALLEIVRQISRAAGCRRVWLITTNDNLAALRFYQKRGMHIAALYPNALELSRLLKPEIPLAGLDGIPLRDEIELEFLLE